MIVIITWANYNIKGYVFAIPFFTLSVEIQQHPCYRIKPFSEIRLDDRVKKFYLNN